MRAAVAVVAAACLVAGCGTGTESSIVPGGDAERGHELIVDHGCGTCHTIAGVDDANATVGPELVDFDENRYIAGEIPNTPENAIRWIMDPQSVSPETIMPDLGLSEQQAADIAAYLYGQ